MNTIDQLARIHLRKSGFIMSPTNQDRLINFVAQKSNIREEFEKLTPEAVFKAVQKTTSKETARGGDLK